MANNKNISKNCADNQIQVDPKTERKQNKETKGRGKRPFPRRNDLAWYARNPALLQATANIPFNQIAGLPLNYGTANNTNYSQILDGVMSVHMQPVFASGGALSYLNDVAKDQYAFVRHANSGHSNYESTDLMITELAITQAYAFYSFMCRAYGLLNYYSGENRYLPKAVFTAMRLDVEDLQKKAADFYSYIVTYAAKLSQFYIPNLTLFHKMSYIYANVYKDSNTNRAQLYLPWGAGYYIYKPTSSTHGGMLDYEILLSSSKLNTLDDLAKAGNDILRPLIIDEDIGIISGDILKAYGKEKCIAAATIKQDYVVSPEVNVDFLSALENATITLTGSGTLTNQVGQLHSASDTFISSKYEWKVATASMTNMDKIEAVFALNDLNTPLNMHVDNPAIRDIVEGTRFMHSWRAEVTGSDVRFYVDTSDLFVINSVSVHYFDKLGTLQKETYNTPFLVDADEVESALTHFASFAIHPRFWRIAYDEQKAKVTDIKAVMDWDTVALMSKDDVDKLNRTCVLSMFDFPQRKI